MEQLIPPNHTDVFFLMFVLRFMTWGGREGDGKRETIREETRKVQ